MANLLILDIAHLALLARNLMEAKGGFTLDQFGNPPDSAITPWAVSVKGTGAKFPKLPPLAEFCSFLKYNPPPDDMYFGGWEADNGLAYFDHTVVYSHMHTAIQEGKRNSQIAIYNLAEGRTVYMKDYPDSIRNEPVELL